MKSSRTILSGIIAMILQSYPGYAVTNMVSIIPAPCRVVETSGTCKIQTVTKILYDTLKESPLDLGQYLSDRIKTDLDLSLMVEKQAGKETGNAIILKLDDSKPGLGDEGYELEIKNQGIQCISYKPAGLFYGIQSLRQIIMASTDGSIPCSRIEDKPQYAWRGLLLDPARHFLDKDFLKRYIDLIAYHKLNRLQLHLTDDQGWRIEIKKYPELTRVGAYRNEDGKPYGGFYSQDDLKELIDYAKTRFVIIVPEFEMPGHASAAIASYPYLSCQGLPIPVETKWGIFPTVFCPGKESTFTFLEGVLDEITEIFPTPYIHIGGDESPRDKWKECPDCQKRMKENGYTKEDELQGYLIRRIAEFLSSKNRRLIGWDEILDAGKLPGSAIVHSWRGMTGAVRAAKLDHDVISSSYEYVYLDYHNDEKQAKAKAVDMPVLPIEKVYQFKPAPADLSPEEAKHVLGGECNMWTERAPQDKIDAQIFPRLCAFSETVWSSPSVRNWSDFEKRLQVQKLRLDRLDVKYYKAE